MLRMCSGLEGEVLQEKVLLDTLLLGLQQCGAVDVRWFCNIRAFESRPVFQRKDMFPLDGYYLPPFLADRGP